jgi:hypothetical protein
MTGHAEDMDSPSTDLDREEHVDPTRQHGADMKKSHPSML